MNKLKLLSSSFIMALTLATPLATYAMEPDEDHQAVHVPPTRTRDNDWFRTYFAVALNCNAPIWEPLTHSNNYKYNQFKDTYKLTFYNPDLPELNLNIVQISNDLEFDLSDRAIFTQVVFDHLIMRVGSYFEYYTPKAPIAEVLLTPVIDSASREITEIRMGMMLPSIDEKDGLLGKAPPTRTYVNLFPIFFDPVGYSMYLPTPTIFPSSYDQLYMEICNILAGCFTLKKPVSTDLWKSPVSNMRRERLDGSQ